MWRGFWSRHDAARRRSLQSGADTEAALDLGVRVSSARYDTTSCRRREQTVALRAATGVLAAAGIDITWLVCGITDASANPEACTTRLTRDELAVRLVRLGGTPSARGQLSLGYSLLDMSAGAGTLATVYVDRVAWLVAQARNSQLPTHNLQDDQIESVLGFAAHTSRDTLLGTNTHAAAG